MEFVIVGSTLIIGTIAVVLSVKPIILDTEFLQKGPSELFSVSSTNIKDGVKLNFLKDSKVLTWKDVLDLWQNEDAEFGQLFKDTLSGCTYQDFFWECVPLKELSTPFECVLLDAKGVLVGRDASHVAFDEHFANCKSGVVTFPNLNNDATLVVPCPTTNGDYFVTLSSFVRKSPDAIDFWKEVGKTISSSLQYGTKLWVNTDGREVPWLHVRLDSGPKYTKYYTSA